MIHLDFVINNLGNHVDWSTLTTTELHYYEFFGEVTFEIDGVDVGEELKDISVYDFAVCLAHIIQQLETSSELKYEFTDSGAEMLFRRSGNTVIEITSPNGQVATTDYEVLSLAAKSFLRDVLQYLLTNRPGLSGNPAFQDALALAKA